MTIEVEIKRIYGVDKVYPLCDNAKLFARIAGTRILTDDTIHYVKQLGYAIAVKQAVVTL